MGTLPKNTLLQNGKYRLLDKIGQGGFGITYKAEMTTMVKESLGSFEMKSVVAIKELFLQDCYRDADGVRVRATPSHQSFFDHFKRKLIEREVKIMVKLKHPHIVNVLDCVEENDTAYLVMEYIDGCSLSDLLTDKRPLPVEQVLKYARQLGDALRFAHGQDVIHMDIKPANILIDKNGDVKLIDFGISKQYSESSQNTRIQTTVVAHSSGYAPIEQYASKSNFRFRPSTDIYSVGATLYHCLTGVLPLEPTDPDLKSMKLVHEINRLIPEHISLTIRKAMENERDNRFQCIDDFLQGFDSKRGLDEKGDPLPETVIVSTGANRVSNTPLPQKIRSFFSIFNDIRIVPFAVIAAFVSLFVITWFVVQGSNEPVDPGEQSRLKEQTGDRLVQQGSLKSASDYYTEALLLDSLNLDAKQKKDSLDVKIDSICLRYEKKIDHVLNMGDTRYTYYPEAISWCDTILKNKDDQKIVELRDKLNSKTI